MQRRKDEGSFFSKYFRSFKHGVDGIIYSIEKELNIVIIMIFTLLALLASFFFNISQVELCLVVISMVTMMAAELINCAIEATVDLITLETNELAKTAKDCASSATLILIFAAITVNSIIFIPKIIDLL